MFLSRRSLGRAVAFGVASLAFTGIASATTITVTATTDDLTPNGNCTLREAIVAANTNAPVDLCPAGAPSPAIDQIDIPAGSYVLSIAGINENAAFTGDLDLTDDVTLKGAGADVTDVDAAGIDRVLDIRTPTTARIYGLTLHGGNVLTNHGGGVWVESTGKVSIEKCTIRDNQPGLFGAGGGIYHYAGYLEVVDTTIRDNTAGMNPALEAHDDGAMTNSTVSGNLAVTTYPPGGGPPSGIGAAIGVEDDARFTITHTTISDNFAELAGWDADVLALQGGQAFLRNTLIDGSCYTGFAPGNGTITSLGGNLESPGTTCPLIAVGDQPGVASPGLVALAANGGPTETHEISSSSPAKDAISTTVCVALDQRGVSRPQDLACDVGAFERRPGCFASVVSGPPGDRTLDPIAALIVAVPVALAWRRRSSPTGSGSTTSPAT